jgi:hypothetical protein
MFAPVILYACRGPLRRRAALCAKSRSSTHLTIEASARPRDETPSQARILLQATLKGLGLSLPLTLQSSRPPEHVDFAFSYHSRPSGSCSPALSLSNGELSQGEAQLDLSTNLGPPYHPDARFTVCLSLASHGDSSTARSVRLCDPNAVAWWP